MAIYEVATQNYIKVDQARSFILNNMVFVAYVVYATAKDRQHEKERQLAFERFDVNALQMIDRLYSQNRIEQAESLSWAVNQIKANRYLTSQNKEVAFTEDTYDLLILCGYDPNWLITPICIKTSKIANSGRYNGEAITQEYLYNKLKEKMSANIQNI